MGHNTHTVIVLDLACVPLQGNTPSQAHSNAFKGENAVAKAKVNHLHLLQLLLPASTLTSVALFGAYAAPNTHALSKIWSTYALCAQSWVSSTIGVS